MPRYFTIDFWIALAVFVCSISGAVLTFSHISKEQHKQGVLVSGIEFGHTALLIRSGDACVGLITVEFSKSEENLNLNADGFVNLRLFGQQLAMSLSAEFLFNSLGQLGASKSQISLKDTQILLGSTKINPITVILRSNLKGTEFRREFSVPGPVSIKELPDQSYSVFYQPLRGPIALPLRGLESNPLFSSLRLSWEVDQQGASHCPRGEMGAIDISALVSAASSLSQKLGPLMSQLGAGK